MVTEAVESLQENGDLVREKKESLTAEFSTLVQYLNHVNHDLECFNQLTNRIGNAEIDRLRVLTKHFVVHDMLDALLQLEKFVLKRP